MQGVRALPAIAACLLCAACAAPPPFTQDGWGVQRRFDSQSPSLVSISEINAASTPATGAIQTTVVRERQRGRYRIFISAEDSIAVRWTAGAALFDAEIDRALAWLEPIGRGEPRGIELRLTLVTETGKRRQLQSHPADRALVVDLLIPVPSLPPSRSAVLEGAMATGLHEASHAVRDARTDDRDDDEYRAALVAACFRIEGLQRRDHIELGEHEDQAQREFTRAHSRRAALAVKRDFAQALGHSRLQGAKRADVERVLQFCEARLAQALTTPQGR